MADQKVKFSLLVCGAPYGTQSASSAYQFCAAAISARHEINVGVLFNG